MVCATKVGQHRLEGGNRMKMIGVIGAGSCDRATYETARQVGRGIAEMGAALVCGGLGGIMEGACHGAWETGGQTIGILPGPDKSQANSYVSVPIVTDLGHARNVLVVRSSDVLVAIRGGYGTLSEISIALKLSKPVIGLNTWPDMDDVIYVNSPAHVLQVLNRFF